MQELKGTMRSAIPSHLTFLSEYGDNGGSVKSRAMSLLVHMAQQILCRSPMQSSKTFTESLPPSVLSQTIMQAFEHLWNFQMLPVSFIIKKLYRHSTYICNRCWKGTADRITQISQLWTLIQYILKHTQGQTFKGDMTTWKEWPRKWRMLKYWLRPKIKGPRNLNPRPWSIRVLLYEEVNHYFNHADSSNMNTILEPPRPHPAIKLMVQGPCLAPASPPTQAAGAASVKPMLKKDFIAHKPTTSKESHGNNHSSTQAASYSFVNFLSFKAALSAHIIITIMTMIINSN